MDCKLTYFTPTYNRANLLPNLYETLLNQTNQNFVWQIVDDGSIDDTAKLVASWQKENKIHIDYIYKFNGGKNSAMEVAFSECRTEYVCIVDSDDFLTEDATDVIYKHIPQCDEECVGIVSRRAHYDKTPFNEAWCGENEKLYFSELASKYGYTEDTCLIFKTNIIKQFHFPRIDDERFITESVLYNKFMYDYKLLTISECIYLAEYQEQGYTSQGMKLFFRNPKGYLYALKQNLFYDRKFKKGLKHLIYGSAYFYAWKSVLKIKDEFKDDYKIPFQWKTMGWILQIFLIPRLRKLYKEMKKEETNFVK